MPSNWCFGLTLELGAAATSLGGWQTHAAGIVQGSMLAIGAVMKLVGKRVMDRVKLLGIYLVVPSDVLYNQPKLYVICCTN